MASEERRKRLADNIARLAAEILQTELKEPLPGVVTVTGAAVTRDLQSVRVFYTSMGAEQERAAAARRLGRVASFVQREVGTRLHLRVTPALRFEYDDQVEKGQRVLRLLAELEQNEQHQSDDSE